MKMKTRLLVAIATASVVPMFSACGGKVECGPNTTEQDGECVSTVDEVTCEEGTVLMDGKCVLDTSGCGEGTELQDGQCVSTIEEIDPPTLCGEGTEYDAEAEACIPSSTIECGDNTIEEDGKCVPDPDAICEAGTQLNDDGVCVVAPSSCGDNTMLDPMTNTCVISDAGVYCGDNTAYDADADSCVPTEDVCDTGTTYSMDTGLCLPDATCKMGDVILNGICVTPAEKLFAEADLASAEAADRAANNDDPTFGGTPGTITPAMMGTAFTVAGEINTPVDLDGDMVADQDMDAYTFTASAGQTFQVSVQPLDGPSLSFAVVGPDQEFLRFSTFGLNAGAARKVFIPRDGDYTLIVAPSIYMAAGFEGGPTGDDTWRYVAQLEEVAAPTATTVDTTMGPLTGELADISDNLFSSSNLTGGELVTLTTNALGEDVGTAVVQLWDPTDGFVQEIELEDGATLQVALPPNGVNMFFDWVQVFGADTSFDVSVDVVTNSENLGAIPAGGTTTSTTRDFAADEEFFYAFSVEPGEVIEISHENADGEEFDIELVNSVGQIVYSETFFDVRSDSSPDYAYYYSANGGNYILRVENNSSTTAFTGSDIQINSITPTDQGMFALMDQISINQPNAVAEETAEFHKIELSTDARVVGTLEDNGGSDDLELYIWDATTGSEVASSVTAGDEDFDIILRAGSYIIQVFADDDDVANGYALTADLLEPPTIEAEPNDDDMTATAAENGKDAIGNFIDGDVDVFSYNVPMALGPNDVWFVYLEPDIGTSSSRNYTCTVRDSAAMEVATATSTNDCGLFIPAVAVGDYYVEVSTDHTSDINYTLMTSVINDAMVEAEPNDDSMTATTWDPTLRALGDVGNDNTDSDWYAFTVPANIGPNDVIEFTISASEENPQLNINPSSTINIDVYDSMAMTSLASTTGFSYPKTTSVGPGLVAGATHYVEVSRTSTTASFTGRYFLDAEVKAGPTPLAGGETCMAATPITMSGDYTGSTTTAVDDYDLPSATSCTGYGTGGNDVAYSVTLAAGQTLDVTMTPSADLALYIVTDCTMAAATCVAGDDAIGSPENVSYTSTAGETVYLIVDSFSSGTSGDYSLTVSITP